jgi:mannose-1-phosphate guanylyltransferase/mannose-6-phosphate isomerase
MEKHDRVSVVPFAGLWSDVGSWNAVADMCPPDEAGNRIEGNGVAIDARNNFILAPTRRVVALGTDDLIVVDTPDAVLVARRGCAEQVKNVVAELQRRGARDAVAHRLVQRPWGSYDSIQQGERFQVKRIIVKPSASLSLQKHYHRAEHWVVVRGTAEVTRGKETFLLRENQSTYIPQGEVHRLHNPGKTLLEMIEVQSGSYLGEDDIVRMDDNYGRVVQIADAKKQA